jgi:hypothetical protein
VKATLFTCASELEVGSPLSSALGVGCRLERDPDKAEGNNLLPRLSAKTSCLSQPPANTPTTRPTAMDRVTAAEWCSAATGVTMPEEGERDARGRGIRTAHWSHSCCSWQLHPVKHGGAWRRVSCNSSPSAKRPLNLCEEE